MFLFGKKIYSHFASAKLPRLDDDESTKTSQTMPNTNDETGDRNGHPSSTATSKTGKAGH